MNAAVHWESNVNAFRFLVLEIILLLSLVSSAAAQSGAVYASGVLQTFDDPDGLLPFNNLVPGTTLFEVFFVYAPHLGDINSNPNWGIYPGGTMLLVVDGTETIETTGLTAWIFDDLVVPSGEFVDRWAVFGPVFPGTPGARHQISFHLQSNRSSPPVPPLTSDQLVEPTWPDGWDKGEISYVVQDDSNPEVLLAHATARISGFNDPIVNISIAIKLGATDHAAINPSARGVIPVAILTTDDFDAMQVDVTTVSFGPNDASITHQEGHVGDIDGDGDSDLILHFRTQETGIVCGDTEATLTGETFAGEEVSGSGALRTVGKNCH